MLPRSKRWGSAMNEKLALLRSLAIRPSSKIAPCLQALLDELCKAGYVTNDKDAGWMTTAEGCVYIESNRTPAAARPS